MGDKSKGIEDKEYKFECEFYEEIDVEVSAVMSLLLRVHGLLENRWKGTGG